jgi:hypothetical protein
MIYIQTKQHPLYSIVAQLQEVILRHTYRYGRADSPRILQRRFLDKTMFTGVQIEVHYYKEDDHTLWVRIAIN